MEKELEPEGTREKLIENHCKTKQKQESRGGGWRKNPGETKPNTGDGAGEPAGQRESKRDTERTPLETIGKQSKNKHGTRN